MFVFSAVGAYVTSEKLLQTSGVALWGVPDCTKCQFLHNDALSLLYLLTAHMFLFVLFLCLSAKNINKNTGYTI